MIVAHLVDGPVTLEIQRLAAYWRPEPWVMILVDHKDRAGDGPVIGARCLAHVWYEAEPDERELDAGEGMSWHLYRLDTSRRENGTVHAYYEHFHRR